MDSLPTIPRKICLLIHSLEMGGAERVAVTLANHWASTGREVTIMTLSSNRDDFYALHEKVRRVRLTVSNKRASNVFAKLVNRITRVRIVKKALREAHADLVIAFMADCNRILALARPPRPTVCIGTQHTYAPHTKERFAKTLSKKINYPKLDAVAALTEDMAEYLRNDIGLCRVPVIPNPLAWPIPLGAPMVSPDGLIRTGSKTILAVGRLVPVKGFDLLLEAFASIRGKIPGWNLVIIGEGSERENLERLIDELNLGERVRLAGRAGNMDEWYARADMFVLSSRREGLPMALCEAMAAGLPCVATNCKTGPSTIITHGVDGMLVAPEDTSALAVGLLALAEAPALRAQFKKNASGISERLSPVSVAGLWDATYAKIRCSKD